MAQKAAQQSQGAQQPRGSSSDRAEAGGGESAEEMARAGDSSNFIGQYFDDTGRTFVTPSHLVGGTEKCQRPGIIYKCKMCQIELRQAGGSTGNLAKHLKAKHHLLELNLHPDCIERTLSLGQTYLAWW